MSSSESESGCVRTWRCRPHALPGGARGGRVRQSPSWLAARRESESRTGSHAGRDLLEKVGVHEEGLAEVVVLEHGVAAEAAQGFVRVRRLVSRGSTGSGERHALFLGSAATETYRPGTPQRFRRANQAKRNMSLSPCTSGNGHEGGGQYRRAGALKGSATHVGQTAKAWGQQQVRVEGQRCRSSLEPELIPARVHHPLGEQQGVEVAAFVNEDLPRLLLPLVAAGDANDRPDGVVGLGAPLLAVTAISVAASRRRDGGTSARSRARTERRGACTTCCGERRVDQHWRQHREWMDRRTPPTTPLAFPMSPPAAHPPSCVSTGRSRFRPPRAPTAVRASRWA